MSAVRPLVLASGSPRRREILTQLGLTFEVVPSEVEEPPRDTELPVDYAVGLAQLKARDVASRFADDSVVLGADTVVVVDNHVLGKPVDGADARAMIARLAGRHHEVITGVSLVGRGGVDEVLHVTTRVWFRALDEAAQARYADSGEGADKAGAYAIQGLGAGLVTRIEGSYSNVVGLPAAQVVELLTRCSGASWP